MSFSRLLGWLLLMIWLLLIGFGWNWANKLQGTGPWKSWEQLQDVKWCERDRTENLVREPSNAWSDVSYLALGLYMIYCGMMDALYLYGERKPNSQHIFNFLTEHPLLSIANGIANIIHAFGTWWNHSCRCFQGAALDISGMLTVTTFPIIYCLFVRDSLASKHRHSSLPYVILLGLAFMTYMTVMQMRIHTDQRVEIAMTVVIALDLYSIVRYYQASLSAGHTLRIGYMLVTALSLVIGLMFHRFDMARIWCYPDSIYQGHAVWHFATCFTLWAVYNFFRTAEHTHKQA